MRRISVLAALLLALPAQAQNPPVTAPVVQPVLNAVTIDAGTGRVIQLGGQAASVFAADPKVAEVRPASMNSLFVFGIAPGRTTIAALGANGAPVAQYDVTVRPSSFGATEARATISRVMPGRSVRVETLPNGLALTGEVDTPADADRAMQIARGYVTENQVVENRLSVLASTQVNLHVRIAEMSRNLTRNLGINWSSIGTIGMIGNFPAVSYSANGLGALACAVSGVITSGAGCKGASFNGLIDALSKDQLVHVLAEPNLTAISGETANFLVGGEFPIPVAQQNNSITIEFKQFGVSLAFVPTVYSGGRISMKVRPEVSALSDQGAITMSAGNSTIQVPALTVRRAQTTVELASGESFAIAGLLQNTTKLTGSGLPGLGDVPILGALFRSDGFQKGETELVIIVTPYLVRPVSDPRLLAAPTDGYRAPNDLERILLLRQTGRADPAPRVATRIPGDAGFVMQ